MNKKDKREKERARKRKQRSPDKLVHVVFDNEALADTFDAATLERFSFLRTIHVFPSLRAYERQGEKAVAFHLTPVKLKEVKRQVFCGKANAYIRRQYKKAGAEHMVEQMKADFIKANLVSRVFWVNYHFVPILREFADPFGRRVGETFTEIAFYYFAELVKDGEEIKHVIGQGYVDRYENNLVERELHRSMAQTMRQARDKIWAPWLVAADTKWLFPAQPGLDISLEHSGDEDSDS
jgi:hypothetical protein